MPTLEELQAAADALRREGESLPDDPDAVHQHVEKLRRLAAEYSAHLSAGLPDAATDAEPVSFLRSPL